MTRYSTFDSISRMWSYCNTKPADGLHPYSQIRFAYIICPAKSHHLMKTSTLSPESLKVTMAAIPSTDASPDSGTRRPEPLEFVVKVVEHFECGSWHFAQLSFPGGVDEESETIRALRNGMAINDGVRSSRIWQEIQESKALKIQGGDEDHFEQALWSHVGFVVVFWNNESVVNKDRTEKLQTFTTREELAGLVDAKDWKWFDPSVSLPVDTSDTSEELEKIERMTMDEILNWNDQHVKFSVGLLLGWRNVLGRKALDEWDFAEHIRWLVYEFYRKLFGEDKFEKRGWVIETCDRVADHEQRDPGKFQRVAESRQFQWRWCVMK